MEAQFKLGRLMNNQEETNAARSFAFCSMFESELLIWLMLRNWNHPLAEDEDHRSMLLENATEVLRAASEGPKDQVFVADLPAKDMNLVSAIWYVEYLATEDTESGNVPGLAQRRKWLNNIRRTLPSCFCPANHLH